MNSLAPIVLFVYNRPSHVLNLFQSLKRCRLSDQSKLIVYSDGPKENSSEEELKKISEVRRIILSEKWCKEIQLIERKKNLGLADSIVSGVTEVLSQNEKIIVLEDDLVLSSGFLQYMNDALNMYGDEEKVMHISAFMYPVKEKLPETFFMNTTSCWGWGTWKRAWKHYNPSAEYLLHQLNLSGRLNEYTFNNSTPFYNHLADNVNGKLNTWAIKWNTSIFLLNGFCLHPSPSLVRNTGNDGTGTHGSESIFNNQFITDSISVNKIPLIEDANARLATEIFYNMMYTKKNLFQRALKKIFH